MKRTFAYFCILLFGTAAAAFAQPPVITAEQVRDRMMSGEKVMVVDVRSHDEYLAGHIPGAVNIPAERVAADRGKLPKDRGREIIFYCRGAG